MKLLCQHFNVEYFNPSRTQISEIVNYLCKKDQMSAYKFRVLIDTAGNEDVFRDIVINPKSNFESFYHAIISAFDFSGDQLASFYLSNDDWDKGQEITLMDMGLANEVDAVLLMSETKIGKMVTEKGQKLILVYDFLRMWCFLIEFLAEVDEEVETPEMLLAVGIAPLEDSKEMDMNAMMGMHFNPELGDNIDDIFADYDEEEDDDLDVGNYEQYDDYDY